MPEIITFSNVNLKIYPLLSTRSQRAMKRYDRFHKRFKPYKPRIQLVKRLNLKLGLSHEQILQEIAREQEILLRLTFQANV